MAVLETAVLPITPYPHARPRRCLLQLGFGVDGVLLVPGTILLELNLGLDLLFVALRKIVDALTNAAGQADQIILRHTKFIDLTNSLNGGPAIAECRPILLAEHVIVGKGAFAPGVEQE